jgi:thiosulfate/3-mercaptopyruvate sulfurtransferase
MNEIVLVDSRTYAEFIGMKKYGEARGGRLPDAILIPFKRMFDKEKKIKSVQELRKLFIEAGIDPENRIETYCTGGIRSAHMAIMLRMAGFPHVRNYDASFYVWAGNPELDLE